MPVAAFAETLDHRIDRLAPHFIVARPAGAGPFPAVFMLHGCGGLRPFQNEVAAEVLRCGAAAIQIDSYTPRRIGRAAAIATVCTGMRLHGRERAGDLFAAFAWARRQPWIDPRRLFAAGWSHGGWTIMDALALRSGGEMARATGLSGLGSEPLEGLAGAFLVYPYAGVGSFTGRRPWRAPAPSVAIVAAQDYIVGDTRAALAKQKARGADIDIHVFEQTTHAFEDAHAQDPRVRFNPAAAAREYALLRALILRD